MAPPFFNKFHDNIFLQRHVLCPRRGRQRCTLRYIMPVYNEHPHFTIFKLYSINGIYLQRHAFYRGRQRCTLRYVMPLYNVQFHNLCYRPHLIGGGADCHIPGTIPDSVLLLRN
ncbi:hypothetical protein SFRURICE_010117 [Spodoptera frugiperda]|nr:hypothetical protein SFRURICE_010117 [Spodoptera frugiperda]